MKKYVFFICAIIALLISLGAKFDVPNTFPLVGKLIIIDPGHGGKDPGSIYKEEYEKEYNLDFAFYLKRSLENLGSTVIMTRAGDYDLSNPSSSSRKRSDFNNRIKLINDNLADMYISLHMNYLNDSKYYGGQVFYSNSKLDNEELARTVQKYLNDFFSLKKDYKKIGNDKYMFSKIERPGVLIEYGFMSSYKDRSNLKNKNYKQELAQTIAKSIVDYFT